jgi:hypothetical protein
MAWSAEQAASSTGSSQTLLKEDVAMVLPHPGSGVEPSRKAWTDHTRRQAHDWEWRSPRL